MSFLPVAVAYIAVLVIGAAILAVAMNQPMETSVNSGGAHGGPGGKQKTSPPGCSQCSAEKKKKA